MAAWGHGIFENDDAMDFVNELLVSRDVTSAVSAVSLVVESDDDLEAPDCSTALAAAEVLVAIAGDASEKLPGEVAEWIKKHRPRVDDDVMDMALQAVRKIRSSSELKDVWSESGEYQEWLAVIADLRARLS